MFLGMPEYVWTSIFQITEILGVGLILGFFASHYQKRKETEYYLQGELAKNRIDSYKNIIGIISGIYNSIAPPLEKQLLFEELLDGMPFRIVQTTYPTFLSGEKEFDEYYKAVSGLCIREHIFLDAKVEYSLNGYLGYLSELKQMLDAFCDVMRDKEGSAEEDRQLQINLAYRCFGIALSQDFGRYYSKLDETISDKVKHLQIGFRGKRLRLKIVAMNNRISDILFRNMKTGGKVKTKLSWWLFRLLFRSKLDYMLTAYPDYLIVLLMRIYYSDSYTVEEFDSLPADRRDLLIEKFHQAFISQLHV